MDIFDRGIVMSLSVIMQKDEIPSSHSADFYYSGITQMQFGEMNWERLNWMFGEKIKKGDQCGDKRQRQILSHPEVKKTINRA